MKQEIVKIVYEIIKKGFSYCLALAGTVLCFLGCLEYAKMPEAVYVGCTLILLSFVFYVGELVIKILNMKYASITSVKPRISVERE